MNRVFLFLFLLFPNLIFSTIISHIEKDTTFSFKQNGYVKGDGTQWTLVGEGKRNCLWFKRQSSRGTIVFSSKKSHQLCFWNENNIVKKIENIQRLGLFTEKKDIFKKLRIKWKRKNKWFSHKIYLLQSSQYASFKKEKSQKPISEGEFCHKVNQYCQNVISNQCHRCLKGFQYVVDYNCPQGTSKICGKVSCGGKEQPACFLGFVGKKEEFIKKPCQKDSTIGYCHLGLNTFCGDSQILICL